MIEEFRVKILQSELDDLKERIKKVDGLMKLKIQIGNTERVSPT